jgi:DMSO/TMAO reductase YedYZ molybdopterin-dependent catalytic subunit
MTSDDVPPDDSKLTRTKSRWAELGKFLTGRSSAPGDERLPPGQHLVRNWPVLDLGQTPNVPRDRYRLDLDGAVEASRSLTFAELMALPQSEKRSDIHCVTTWSRYDNEWKGVSTRDLFETIAVKPEASHVVLHANDGYTTNLRLDDFLSPDAILAHSWQGEPLTLEHGGPVRLVVPHLYFWKSAKWLRRIEFTTVDKPGFWEVRGYHNRGDPWQEERYS